MHILIWRCENVCMFILTMMTLLEVVYKKQMVTRKTVEGWMSQYDKEFHMMRWLDFLMQCDEKHVAEVKYKVCCKFKERLISLQNYTTKYLSKELISVDHLLW